ncbi:MAG: hypothetical protein CSA20_01990 [Deltaproteobacteria bacterium]|nr:MAG: hypothetical protein CSA20_01990 [Deltaproteobacteria bacterium]
MFINSFCQFACQGYSLEEHYDFLRKLYLHSNECVKDKKLMRVRGGDHKTMKAGQQKPAEDVFQG